MYDGFISYSHAADGLLAPRLQAGLQRFAKPWWKRRALRIFRDESSLSANPHLWSSITAALDTSGWFVLLLSPDAAASEWVNQEIAYWVEHKDPDRIIPVVTDGEFGWDGSEVTGSSVPAALRGVLSEEPRWVDLRFAKDEDQLDLQDPRFADAVADIASAMRGVPKDELASEEVRQHRRTVRTAWAAGAMLLVLAVAAGWAGFLSAQNAEEARAKEEEAAASGATARSRELSAASVAALASDPELSLLLALRANAVADLEAEGVQALRAAVAEHKAMYTFEWTRDRHWSTYVGISPRGDLLMISGGLHEFELWDISAPRPELLWVYEDLPAGYKVISRFTTDGEQIRVEAVWRVDVPPSTPQRPPEGLPTKAIWYLDARTGEVDSEVEPIRNIGGCRAEGLPKTYFGGSAVDPDGFWVQLGRCGNENSSVWWWPVSGRTGEVLGEGTVLDGVFDIDEVFATTDGRVWAFTDEKHSEAEFIYEGGSGDERSFDRAAELPRQPMSPTGRFLIGDDEIFDAITNEALWTYMPPEFEWRDRAFHPCELPHFSADEALVVVHCFDGTVRVHEAVSGRLLDELRGHQGGVPLASLSEDSSLLATGAADATRLWDLTRGRGVAQFNLGHGYYADASLDVVGDVGVVLVYPDEAASPFDNATATLLDPTPGVVVVFDTGTGELISRMEGAYGKAARLSPDGSLVAFQDEETGDIVLHDVRTGGRVLALDAVCHRGASTCPPKRIPEFDVTDLDWSSDGAMIAAAGGEMQRLFAWDANTGEMLYSSQVPLRTIYPASAVQISPDGSLVVIASKTASWVYETATWTEVEELVHLGAPSWAMEFTPDGSQLVTAQAHHGQLRVFDTASWEATLIETGSGQTRDISVSADGSRVALSNNAGSVHIIDLVARETVDTYPLPGADITNVEILDDSHLLVTDAFGPVEVLTLDTSELLALARSRLNRTFSDEECRRYRIDPCPTLDQLRES